MISKRIKELRLENELTQRELADKLHITPKMISFYELGDRTPGDDIKIQMSKIFNVSVDYLLGESDIKNPYQEQNNNIKKIDGDIAAHLDGKEFNDNDKQQILSFIDFINSKNKE